MIKDYLAGTALAMERVDIGEIDNAIRMLLEVRACGGTVWIAGNGGSSSNATHFANDLTKMGGVRAIALSSLSAHVSAYGNDNGWERMYADLLTAVMRPEDVLVAISCSGNSHNVVRAAELFHHNRLIIMTGNKYDSCLAGMDSDSKIFVVDEDIRIQEDVHLAICHAITGALR